MPDSREDQLCSRHEHTSVERPEKAQLVNNVVYTVYTCLHEKPMRDHKIIMVASKIIKGS